MDNTLFEQVDQYIGHLLAPEDKALIDTTASTEAAQIPLISISPVQGKLLQVFARACNAHRILELGTLGGYSTIWLARALPAGGKVITLELEPTHAAVAQKNIDNARLADKVEIRVGRAMEVLEQMIASGEAPFDLVFIDADKPPYKEYFQLALRLSRQGTIIICDNVVRNGSILETGHNDERVTGVQRLNEYLGQCREVTATILQMVGMKEYDGMAIAVVEQPQ